MSAYSFESYATVDRNKLPNYVRFYAIRSKMHLYTTLKTREGTKFESCYDQFQLIKNKYCLKPKKNDYDELSVIEIVPAESSVIRTEYDSYKICEDFDRFLVGAWKIEEKRKHGTSPYLKLCSRYVDWNNEEEAILALSFGMSLKYAPKEKITYNMCLHAKKNCRELAYVPEKHKTYEMCLDHVKRYGTSLAYVDNDMKTDEMCNDAVKSYSGAISFVPINKRTYTMCLNMMVENGELLSYVPKNLRSYGLCLLASLSGAELKDVPEDKRTTEIRKNIVPRYYHRRELFSSDDPSIFNLFPF